MILAETREYEIWPCADGQYRAMHNREGPYMTIVGYELFRGSFADCKCFLDYTNATH